MSDGVLAQLEAFTTGVVTRLSGTSRFGTAAAVSAAAFSPGVPMVYIATGAGFPDALTGGAAGAERGGPVLLVSRDSIPAETSDELVRLQPASIVCSAGRRPWPPVFAALADFTDGDVVRLSGVDRFATAAAIMAETFPGQAETVFVATGANVPDALAGAAAAGALGAPLLLAQPTCLPGPIAALLERLDPTTVTLLGGESALGQGVGALTTC